MKKYILPIGLIASISFNLAFLLMFLFVGRPFHRPSPKECPEISQDIREMLFEFKKEMDPYHKNMRRYKHDIVTEMMQEDFNEKELRKTMKQMRDNMDELQTVLSEKLIEIRKEYPAEEAKKNYQVYVARRDEKYKT